MNPRKTSMLLISFLVLSIGAFAYTCWQLGLTRNELNAVTEDFNELSETVNMFIAEAGDGSIVLTTSYSLQFVRDGDDRFGYEGPTSALFYAPGEDSIFEIFVAITEPWDGVTVPVVIHEGNAIQITSATICTEKDGFSLCHAPIVWEANITETGMYTTTLPSKGWYTISISGRIEVTMPAGGFHHPLIGSRWLNGAWEVIPVNVKTTFRVINEEYRYLFAVDESYVIP